MIDSQNAKHFSAKLGRQLKSAVKGNVFDRARLDGFRWHLDFPDIRQPAWLMPSGWVVQGWVLLPDALSSFADHVRVIARWSSAFELCHPLSLNRPDVIEAVLHAEPDNHPQLRCGFRFTVPRHLTTCTLELCINGERMPLSSASMPELTNSGDMENAPLKVLEGKAGWLFLDNDTNGSVDQFRGCLQLTDEGIKGWQSYLSAFHALAKRHASRHAVLVAPSKESVMGPLYHLFPEGEGGPISQLLALPEANHFVYPVEPLAALGDDAFMQTDTHWGQLGAMAASKALVRELGLDDSAVAKVFVHDEYHERKLAGDLGNKFSPERQCTVKVLRSFNYAKYRIFDNGLPNFGRLLVLAYDEALMPGTCLIFGSSSSYSMFNYLSRLFKHVVFVHSAGSLDPELVAAVKPDYLVVQTNARFVVQVPKAEQSLASLIEDKRKRLTEEECEALAKREILVSKEDEIIISLGLSTWVEL